MTDEDGDLVERLKEGDETALEELLRKYQKRAHRVAFSITRSHQDAEDISQEAFIRAYYSIGKFRGKCGFYTWFYRILINLCLQWKRRQRYFRWFSQDKEELSKWNNLISEEVVPAKANWVYDPGKALLRKELRSEIERAMKLLSIRQRACLTLHIYEGFTIKEIAEILRCRQGTVKSHLFRAIRKLRALLRPYMEE